jgi:hypothetical protein
VDSRLSGDAAEYSVVADRGTDSVSGVAVARDGSLWMTGVTTNAQLPLSDNAVDRTLASFEEGYVIKLDARGEIAYSTYLGGNALDYPGDIAVDREGNAYIAGATYSTDFPRSADARQPEVGFPLLPTLFITKLPPPESR